MFEQIPDSTGVVLSGAVPGDTLQNEYSIGLFLPTGNHQSGTVPFRFSTVHDTSWYNLSAREGGELLAGNSSFSDFAFVVLTFSLLLLTLLKAFASRELVSGLSFLGFSRQKELPVPNTSGVLSWPPLFRNIFTAVNLSLFALLIYYQGFPDEANTTVSPGLLMLAGGGLFLLSLILRHFVLIITAGITSTRTLFREYMNVIYNSWFADAIILFILNAIIFFTPQVNFAVVSVTGIIVTGIILFIRLLRLANIFIKRHISIFYFILYLCALEVLPVLVIAKASGLF